jgi:hypothetical protein
MNTSIRDCVIRAGVGWCAFTHQHDNSKAAIAAASEALRIAIERLLSNTEAVPPLGMLTPMQVAANQLRDLLNELEIRPENADRPSASITP